MGKLFGTDGIRGKANQYPMDAETAMAAGRAIAECLKQTDKTRKPCIFIGQDTRISGDMLSSAVASGICSAGVNVSVLGVLPTPAVAYLTASSNAVAGIVISASHNPYEDNGIKVFNSEGYKLSDTLELQIEKRMAGQTDATRACSNGIGRLKPLENPTTEYISFLTTACPDLSLDRMTIVLDCANGATYRVAPDVFKRLGATVIPLYCTPDGVNINDGCGSQYPQKLSETVVEEKASLGLAFDGDGDRLIAVDERGTILTGDQIIAVCARDLMEKGKLRNKRVVTTVMSNIGFNNAMTDLGIETFRTSVGDRYVMETMLAQDAVLGGEDSGHIIFRDVHTTGDGLMAALRLLDAMIRSGKSLSELAGMMTVFPQKMVNVDVNEKPDLDTIPEIRQTIRQVEADLGDKGRVLVRYSGTQNKCRVMVEGPTAEETLFYCEKIADTIRNKIGA